MKKTILATIFSVFYLTSVSADVGVNVGFSGQVGIFAASGTENVAGTGTGTRSHNGSEHGEAGWGSVFIEKTLGSRLAIGVDYVPGALETETTESVRYDKTTTDTRTAKENTVQVDFDELTTLYLTAKLNDNLYIKAGMMEVDVITNESLATGSTYGNTSLDGTMLGIGYNNTFDNGLFIRAEGNYMDFDGASLTSSANSNDVKIDQLHGVSAKLSVGQSF